MTKQTEIATLDKMIAAFGPDSYLGPWLAENRDRIVADITSDLEPAPLLPAAAVRQALEIRSHAIAEATEITTRARTDADRVLEKARTDASEIRYYLRNQIERAIANL